jgi:hypothetical protein
VSVTSSVAGDSESQSHFYMKTILLSISVWFFSGIWHFFFGLHAACDASGNLQDRCSMQLAGRLARRPVLASYPRARDDGEARCQGGLWLSWPPAVRPLSSSSWNIKLQSYITKITFVNLVDKARKCTVILIKIICK